MKKLMAPIYLLPIFGVLAALALVHLLLAFPVRVKLAYLLLAPFIFSFSFALVAGLLNHVIHLLQPNGMQNKYVTG